MVTRHTEGACVAPSPKLEAGKQESPFNVLAALKRQ